MSLDLSKIPPAATVPSKKPCGREELFETISRVVEAEQVDVESLIEQTGHTEQRVREVVYRMQQTADAVCEARLILISDPYALVPALLIRNEIDKVGDLLHSALSDIRGCL